MKYAFITKHRHSNPLLDLCALLNVSISGYRAWARGGTQHRKRLSEPQMITVIRATHAEVKGAYGSPRMVRALRQKGLSASKGRVERLMRDCGIRARHKRRYKQTTDSKHYFPIANNHLNRNFTPVAPNRVWTADMTYLWTDEGWLYLAIVLDLFNREVVGWSMKPRMTTALISDALTMAWQKRRPPAGLVHHSDRGSQYASGAFQDQLKAYGMICSMSRKGNCWDNAPTESWFNSFKNERVHGFSFGTRTEMKALCFDYIEVFYNRKRLHSTLGYKSPQRFLEGWLKKQQQEKQVA